MKHERFNKAWYKDSHWPTSIFLILNPLIGVCGLIWAISAGHMSWPLFLFSTIFGISNNLAVTAGYHRLFAHRTYAAKPWIEWVFLLIGASAFQGSVLKWASDHRRHHFHIDTEKDPYNIQFGFWYAHMGWLFRKDSVELEIKGVNDLMQNPRVVFQDKYYFPIAILISFLLPGLVGYALGSFWAGVLVGGSFRITLSQQSTFFVNSLSHTLGKRPYCNKISARDSIIVSILTHGEGYHNFHHKFQSDFRNGIRWYHWDPTKWVILTLKYFGIATKLKQISPAEILKAKLEVDGLRLQTSGYSVDKVEQIRQKIILAQQNFKLMKDEYQKMKLQALQSRDEKVELFKKEMKKAKKEFRSSLAQWNQLLKRPAMESRANS